MFLLVLFPAGLHEEGIRGHFAPGLVGVSFTHGDRRRPPGGAKAGGWAPAGLGFPPKCAPARLPPHPHRVARAAQSPAPPGPPASGPRRRRLRLRAHAPPGPNPRSPSRVSSRAITTSLPEAGAAARPPLRVEEGNAASALGNPFPDRNLPRLLRREP